MFLHQTNDKLLQETDILCHKGGHHSKKCFRVYVENMFHISDGSFS